MLDNLYFLWHNHRAVKKRQSPASPSVGAPVRLHQVCYDKVAPLGSHFPHEQRTAEALRPRAFQAVFDGGDDRHWDEKRDFGVAQKVVPKPLDKAQWICDTTVYEASKRKRDQCLSDDETPVSSDGTLTTEEWKAEQQLEHTLQ